MSRTDELIDEAYTWLGATMPPDQTTMSEAKRITHNIEHIRKALKTLREAIKGEGVRE